MSTLPTLAVTGSTGALGGLVARDLADRGVPQRLLARSPERAPRLPGAVPVHADYADRDAAVLALQGVRTLLMVSGSESADRLQQHRTFVDAAVDAGVEQIVYTSFFGATADCTFTLGRDHWATEEHIRSRGTAFTFFRDNFYLDFLPLTVGEDGVIRGPAGDVRFHLVPWSWSPAAVGADLHADAATRWPGHSGRRDAPRRPTTGPHGRIGRSGTLNPWTSTAPRHWHSGCTTRLALGARSRCSRWSTPT